MGYAIDGYQSVDFHPPANPLAQGIIFLQHVPQFSSCIGFAQLVFDLHAHDYSRSHRLLFSDRGLQILCVVFHIHYITVGEGFLGRFDQCVESKSGVQLLVGGIIRFYPGSVLYSPIFAGR